MPLSTAFPSFNLIIITPKKSFHYSITMIEVETPTGSFTIASNHAALVSCVKKKCIITFESTDGETHTLNIESGGLFKMLNNRATLILHQAQI
jgi:F0F1-type ATP synthase epsilon subunit